MNRVISCFLVGLAILLSVTFSPLGSLPAQAAPTTPEATEYQVDHSDSHIRINPGSSQSANPKGEGVVESLQDAGKSVRDKLNLNEPLPEGTKAFFKQVRGEDVTVDEPRPSGKGQTPQNN